jgi:hypothetical protein
VGLYLRENLVYFSDKDIEEFKANKQFRKENLTWIICDERYRLYEATPNGFWLKKAQ